MYSPDNTLDVEGGRGRGREKQKTEKGEGGRGTTSV